MPRAICGTWTPGMIFLHNASDFLIWTACIAIPLVLAKFAYAKQRELPFRRLFWLFGLFILACGTTHFMDIVIFYNPLYRLAGVIKSVTAVASWGTVFALFHVTPLALQMRSPEDLEREIDQRQRAETELQQALDNLEVRVHERTSNLEAASVELSSSEARFRMLTEVMPQIVWTARPDGFLDYYNGHWVQYTGMTIEQTQGWGWQPVLHPDDLDNCLDRWTEAVRTGGSYEVEYRFKRASDGAYRWHLGRALPLRDEAGNITKWFGTCTDIDDQKRAQLELQRSQHELESLVQERTGELSRANQEQQSLLAELERSTLELESRVMRRTATLQVRTEELNSSLSLLTATIESTADGIVALDLAGNIVSHSTKFDTMWRFPADLLERCDGAELRAHAAEQTKDPDRFSQIVRRHLAAPEIETFDTIEMKDGRAFERYGFPQRVNETCVGVVVNFCDITERKRAEGELHRSEVLKTAILETALDCIIGMDHEGFVTEFNPAAEKVFGYARADVMGRSLAEVIIPPALRESHSRGMQHYLETGEGPVLGQRIEVPALHADGSEIAVELAITRIPATEPPQFTAYLRDITARKHAEAERENLLASERNAREEAERANASKDEFLSRMSHELRTPLNAILGFGQILEMQQKQLSASHNESVQQILKAGQHQLDLVNEVLDITRINAPDSALSPEAVDLGEVVQEALDMLQALATPTGISLSQHRPDAPPIFVLADRQRLLQILLNLLANAIKFNKPGGQVRVSAEVWPEHRVCFHVRDTGHGIAAEDLPKLFVPFSRLNAEKLGVEGTGLGLVLCQRLAQAMNGSLHVESQPGLGSTFSVELPQAQPPLRLLPLPTASTDSLPSSRGLGGPGAPSATAASATAPLAEHTILLIEDNISNFQLIERVLADLSDVRLVGAMQGRLGVELAIHHQPELILLDLHLPDIMGDEVLRRLKARPETQNIPVIVLSADATPSQISRLLALGARQYLTKPLNMKQFLQALKETIYAC